MPQLKVRQLGVSRSQCLLANSQMIQASELVTHKPMKIQSMEVKGDSFGTKSDTKPKIKDIQVEKIASEYECQLLSELEHHKITIMELQAKLQEKSRVLTEVQKKRKEENLRHQNMILEMTEEHQVTKAEMSRANSALNHMNDKLYNAEKEANEKLEILKEMMEKEKTAQLEEKDAEIAWQKGRLDSLKKQICDTLTGNSLIRQKQLEEMSKELGKVNDEALQLKQQKCQILKVKKTYDLSCLECKNKLMAMKLKDIEIAQLRRRIKYDGIEQVDE